MAHSEICPVCKGKGKLEDTKPCHGCGGLGWITVGVEYPVYHPPIYYHPVYPDPYPYPSFPYYPNWTCHSTCGEPIKEA